MNINTAIIVDVRRKPPRRKRQEAQCGLNIFADLLVLEGLTCFTLARRRSQVRNQLYRYIHEGCNYRRIVEDVIHDILDMYTMVRREAVSKDDGDDREAACLELLATAAHLCEKFQIRDAELISYVMTEHFLLLGGHTNDWFEFLNPFGSVGRLTDSSLYPYRHDRRGALREWITSRHLNALDYFLVHGNRMELLVTRSPWRDAGNPTTTNYDRVSFVDFPLQNPLFGFMTPLTLACLSAHPPAVLLLLRHGGSPLHPYKQVECPYQDWSQPLYAVVNQLNLRQDEDLGSELEVSSPEGRETLQNLAMWRGRKLVQCLQLLSRAATPSQLPLRFSADVCRGHHDHRHGSRFIYLHERFTRMLPRRCTAPPADLQHLCRCALRRRLKTLNRLPDGIHKLALPNFLRLYLDLRID
ncbi:hypothetical protein NP493_404g02074 [Ridgeia piscesae]|uniref:SOCS box domain-containing protein n=1 Tax=Ridgeia piscesae TaxID=27915 RepID=A0AAD9L1I5_RIDPI|nr:hypothetical protein NP493_404g02074 [Ridgeia piscesae]